MFAKEAGACKKIAGLILILLSPIIYLGIPLRLAFTESFVQWEYSRKGFPADPYGMDYITRKKLALLGLKAVLSDKGFEEFKRAKLPDGRKAFNQREIKHIEDVKKVVGTFFKVTYALLFSWIAYLIVLRNKKSLATAVILSGAFSLLIYLSVLALSLINYHKAFEVFHNIVFDPYSWRFSYTDTLIRIYPMKFWYDATILVLGGTIFLSLLSVMFGFLTLKYRKSS